MNRCGDWVEINRLIDTLKRISVEMEVEVRYGDYPYAAYISHEVYEQRIWAGYWFAYKPDDSASHIIFVPNNLPEENSLSGLIHELGHIVNDRAKRTHKNQFEEEVKAWTSGLEVASWLGLKPLRHIYLHEAEDGLVTYCNGNTDDVEVALTLIDAVYNSRYGAFK